MGMGLHLEDCIRDSATGACQFAPGWMHTAFSWAGKALLTEKHLAQVLLLL